MKEKLLSYFFSFQKKFPQKNSISSPQSAVRLLADIRAFKKEYFVALLLNSRNELILREIISIGSVNASIVHPREVFEPAIRESASSLILAHNHPSGDSTPSEEDETITKRLKEAGKIIGIDVIDHIIVSKNTYFSFKEHNLL
jgi:DNA repair protein RadC